MSGEKKIRVVAVDTVLELQNAADQFGIDSIEHKVLTEDHQALYSKIQKRCVTRYEIEPTLDEIETVVDEILHSVLREI